LTAIKCPHCGDEDLYRWSARSDQTYTPKNTGSWACRLAPVAAYCTVKWARSACGRTHCSIGWPRSSVRLRRQLVDSASSSEGGENLSPSTGRRWISAGPWAKQQA